MQSLICIAPPFLGRQTSYGYKRQLTPEARLQSANIPALRMAKNLSSTRIALCSTPAWRLDKFIEGHLLGDITFLTELRTDVNSISAFLKERCFQGAAHPMRVSRVVMVSPISLGSSGWGGRGRSEARLQSLVGCELPTCSVPSVLT